MEMVMANGFTELSFSEKEDVNGGGFPWGEVAKAISGLAAAHPYATAIVITAAGAYGCWCAGQAVGKEIGKFIYNCGH